MRVCDDRVFLLIGLKPDPALATRPDISYCVRDPPLSCTVNPNAVCLLHVFWRRESTVSYIVQRVALT